MHTQTISSVHNLETPHPSVIRHKMQCALEYHKFWGFGLIQFWVPVTRNGQRLLTTSGQPVTLSDWNIDVAEHRRSSEKYLYSIEAQQVDEDDILTIKGPLATAFLNHLPLFIYNLKCYPLKERSYPLLASAISYGLTRYLVLPVFDPSTKCCVGVLESYMSDGDIEDELNQLIASIQIVGLIAFDPREWQLFESIQGLQHANGEIKGAFETICDSHKLCFAQAWIRYEDKNHEPYLFMQNKRELALKLLHYCNPERDRGEHWIKFCNECDIHPLRMGEGLVGKSLENHEPYLCKDISMVDMNEPSLSHTGGIKGSSFAICLRSSYTQNLDYVLEFFWTDGENVIELLESILSTLERTLPSFKVVSGKDIGNKLHVKEITYSSEANGCVVEGIVISSQANKSSSREHDTSHKHQGVIELVGSIKIDDIISHEPDKSSNKENDTSHVHQEDIEQVDSEKSLNCESAASEEIGSESCIGESINSSESAHEANKISKRKCIVISHEINKISKRKRSTTRIPLSREAILQQKKHSGRTREEAAKNLGVCVKTLWRRCTEFGIKWKEPNPGKGKLSEFEGEQNDTNGVDIQTTQDPLVIIKDSIPNKSTLIIKAKYKGDCVIIKLPSLQAVEEKISKAFKLDRGSYKLKYRDEVNDTVLITCDEDFGDCLESFRSREITTIQLDVFSDDLLSLYL